MQLPIFPLSVFLLPGGCLKLRIFEPRYLKMISLALKEQGFVISLCSEQLFEQLVEPFDLKAEHSKEKPWGSWVEINNFNQGSDGILEIEVLCHSLVQLTNSCKKEHLIFAEVEKFSHWSQESAASYQPSTLLADSLAKAFTNNEALHGLYLQPHFDDYPWVVARWLELLPIDAKVKNTFIRENNFLQAKHFVESILKK